jgi:AraC-like DNA-binding protein
MSAAPTTLAKLDAADRFISAHFGRSPSLAEIAEASRCSVVYLCRAYKKVRGRTIKAVVTDLRIREAKRLLAAGNSAIAVASQLHFVGRAHFCARFKAIIGKTPMTWLREEKQRISRMSSIATRIT